MTVISDIILEKLNTLLVVINNQGKLDYVSPSVSKALGVSPEILNGQGWFNLTRKNAAEMIHVKEEVKLMIQSEVLPAPFEREFKTARGEKRWILWSPSKGPDNSVIGIGYDITERKIAEERIQEKNRELQKKNSELLDSLKYAQTIQEAILPDIDSIKASFKKAFVYYNPKDIVSGDFYFHYKTGNRVFVAAVDCTGHGVPGALMSVIGNSLLKDIVVKRGTNDPAQILRFLDEELFTAINRSGKTVTSDGMDVAIGVFDFDKKVLTYSGAFRTLLYVRNQEVLEVKGNRYPIGFYQDVVKSFESVEIPLQQDDSFYFFSDGYADQFGGEQGKKLNRKRFKDLLLTINEMEADEQESFLDYALTNWKQEEEQTDDILIIGIGI
ncbi:MAG: SpoIIE family protein phosphatase [Bacteroidetes bacterium]|nr:SpoIIE family protein phosphatase [Bacteroidota bacterium]HET6243193.1 SpoIIE family protein phosphatase [Bacteroidia bacterium]